MKKIKLFKLLALFAVLITSINTAWATDYYYRGDRNGWGATKMTQSEDGHYYYYECAAGSGHNFKIALSESGWDYNNSKIVNSFNGCNITLSGSDNIWCPSTSKHYIIIYKPDFYNFYRGGPAICASTKLPKNDWYIKHNWGGGSWTWQKFTKPATGSNYTYEGQWGNAVCNINTEKSDSYSGTIQKTDISGYSTFSSGDNVIFTYNPQTNALSVSDKTYTVSVAATSGGSVSKASLTAGKYTASATVTASNNTGYHFTGWTMDDGVSIVAPATSSSTSVTIKATGTSKTLTANFAPDTYTAANNIKDAGNNNKGQFTATYDATTIAYNTKPTKTGYSIEGLYKTNTAGVLTNKIVNGETALCSSTSYTSSTGKWNYTGDCPTLYVNWSANSYTVTLKPNGATSGSDQTVSATYDASMPGTTTASAAVAAPSKTGYAFTGFWDSSTNGSGTKYYNADLSSAHNWDKTTNSNLWAQWQANNYTVTLNYDDEEGYGSKGVGVKDEVSATYGSTMPAMGTAPTPAPGYKFMGYYASAGGVGTQYYAADGSSVTNWNVASATTLHAYFQKTEISSLEHPASIANGDEITLDVNPIFNQTGAQNYMDICWSLLYDNDNPVDVEHWSVEPYTAGGSKPDQVRFTLTGMSSGYYKVQAVLKANASSFTACAGGTELCTIKSSVRIAGNTKVTILYKDNSGNTLAASQTIEIASGESEGVKAPSMIGYSFTSWTLDPVLTNTCESSASCGMDKDSINISAAYDGFLTANYTKKQMIYFNNTLGWEDVYVYFYNDGSGNQYWANGYGTGANKQQQFGGNNPYWEMEHGHMTQIEGTNIWYFDFKAEDWYSTTRTKVAFANVEQSINKSGASNDEAYFHNASVVYRTDFDVANLPMFVPINSVAYDYTTNTGSTYYRGYWMNYPEGTGYTLKIYDNNTSGALKKSLDFTFPADMKMPMSITTDLEAGKTYGFKIERADATSYGNTGTMSNGHSGDEGQTVWEFKSDVSKRCGLTTSSAGDYTFTLSYGEDASHNYNYLVGVHFPEATGDYRVLYKDNVHTNWLASAVIPKNLDHDTISYFVRKAESPVMKLQKCTATYSAGVTTVTWTDTVDNLIPTLPSAITEDGVYYFCINKNPETGKRELGDTKPYEGNFYIRVDGAGYSNWDNFRASDHLMPYSDYSFKQTTNPYSHYFTKWYDCSGGNKNIKFVVANDYSVCISDTLARETATGQWANIADYIDAIGNLNRSANVRFMYNYKTNEVSRAFIDGAYADGGNFLKILAQTSDGIYLVPSGEAGDPQTEITFKDNGNWVYEKTVYAVPGARYKLRSLFGTTDGGNHVITQYFKGGEGSTAADSATMIGGDGASRMQIRLLYDFKTNRVVTAYQPSGTIDANLAIHADIMFMREHQGDVEQITFASGKSITDIENIYCGLRFNKWTLNNRKKDGDNGYLDELLSRYERDIFYVSFPYDVKLSDVIGFGTYGTHWIVEYYDGAARAKDGFWIDSESYWKFVTPAMKDTFTLKAGTGYIVALDLDELYCFKSGGIITQASVWTNTSEVELLFPGKVTSISDRAVTFTMPTHQCTINRGTSYGNRTIKDSHWNVLGVPTFKNITGAASVDGGGSGAIRFANVALLDTLVNDMKFIYDGNLADNSLTAKAVKDFEFKAMHAYVVQYCGNVTFTTSASPAPSSIVARRTYAEKPVDVDFRLELAKDGVMEDQTFISLSNNENASADFVFGEDLSKEFNNNRANIYTFIGTEWAAGNTLPMSDQTTIVPVGVKIAAEGEYTFSIPEGTYGVGITLIDNETGTRTNLGLMEYTVNLGAEQIDNRFLLEISPIKNTPTGIDNTDVRNSSVRKVMVDGTLYIIKDGKVFDAQGARVK